MKMEKKIMSLFLTIVLCINYNITTNAATFNNEIKNIANVVYFVDFNDSQGNFVDGKMNRIKDMFNGDKDTALTSYIKKISYNKMNVHNYFPQEVNGSVTPYRLSKNRGYYNKYNEYEMINEVIKNVQVDASYNIDMNNDGYVDNAIFVFFGGSNGKDDVFWPHKTNHNGGSSINGKKVDVYNLHNSSRLIDDTFGAEGVLAHEFLHSIDYPDLYKNTEDSTPVGTWDIMASTSSFLQYPLAYTRSTISNWLTIDTVTRDGTYTLKPSSSTEGNQAFILKTPMSNNEFFVVEYRKKGNPYMGELDGKIPGSGIIIYRVNTDENTNHIGDKNFIYVFRPGETDDKEGFGNLSKAFLSKESGRTSYGSEDFSKGLSDNAITYSSGQNSGIVINNVSEAGEEISFDVKFTDTSTLGVWNVLGDEVISNSSDYNSSIDIYNDKIYAVYSEGEFNKKLKAKLYDGEKWIALGDNILNESGSEPKIKVFNDIPYVLYHDKDYKTVVAKFDNNIWQKVQTMTSGVSQYSDMEATSNGLYITYTEPDSTILKVSKLNTETNKFEMLGGNIHNGYIVYPSLSESDGNLYVSFNDFSAGNKVYVKKFIGGNWVDIPGLDIKASKVELKAYNNKLYLATTPVFGGNTSEVYLYNEGIWNRLGEGFAGNNITSFQLDVHNGKPYVSYIDVDNGSTEMKYFDGTSWVKEGLSISNEKTSSISLKIYGNKAYVGLNSTNSGGFYIKYKSIADKILEDINNDGVVDILDLTLVALKYNFTNTDIEYHENFDLNKDGLIDLFDLIFISKKIE